MKDGYSFGKKFVADTIEVNGNWYYVLTYPETGMERKDHWKAYVYAYDDGREMEELNPGEVVSEQGLKRLAKMSMKTLKKDYELHVAELLNEAICELENKQERTQDYRDRISSALEANKEVHEGLDYKLR